MLMDVWTEKKPCSALCYKACKKLIKYFKSNTLHAMRGVHTDQKVDIKALSARQAGKTEHWQSVLAPLGAAIIGWVILCFLHNQLVSFH